jgi:hypothetical protein
MMEIRTSISNTELLGKKIKMVKNKIKLLNPILFINILVNKQSQTAPSQPSVEV